MSWIPFLLIIAVLIWPHLWLRLVKNRIEINVVLHKREVGMGDEIPIDVMVRNRSWLPCPFVNVFIKLPAGLSADPVRVKAVLQWMTFLWMRQEVQATFFCYAQKRGLHDFSGEVQAVQVNEGFGLRDSFLHFNVNAQVVVRPTIHNNKDIKIANQSLLGNVEVIRWIQPDETMLRGYRVYRHNDLFKHIGWLATAKTGTLMTKEFISSTDRTVTCIVNAQFFQPHWLGTRHEVFDDLCSIAATWAMQAANRKFSLQFATNATNPHNPLHQWYGIQRIEGICTLLGRVMPYTNGALEEIILTFRMRVAPGGVLVLFTSFLTSNQQIAIQSLQASGYVVHIYYASNEAPLELKLKPVSYIALPFDEAKHHA